MFGVLQDDDEADTVGCCTLKVENVEPSPPNILKVNGFYPLLLFFEYILFTKFSVSIQLQNSKKGLIVLGNVSISLCIIMYWGFVVSKS